MSPVRVMVEPPKSMAPLEELIVPWKLAVPPEVFDTPPVKAVLAPTTRAVAALRLVEPPIVPPAEKPRLLAAVELSVKVAMATASEKLRLPPLFVDSTAAHESELLLTELEPEPETRRVEPEYDQFPLARFERSIDALPLKVQVWPPRFTELVPPVSPTVKAPDWEREPPRVRLLTVPTAPTWIPPIVPLRVTAPRVLREAPLPLRVAMVKP